MESETTGGGRVLFERCYRTDFGDSRGLREAWGRLYSPPASFNHAEWALIATLPPVHPDGRLVQVHEMRLPARCYRVAIGAGEDRVVLATGTRQEGLVIAIAAAARGGVLTPAAAEGGGL